MPETYIDRFAEAVYPDAGQLALGSFNEEKMLTDATERIIDLESRAEKAEAEVVELRQWVNDLQAGTYVTCIYCGHSYGPDDEVPTCMADVLKEHIAQCPQHPMSALKAEVERLKKQLCPPVRHARRIEFWAVPERPHVVCMSDEDFMAWGRERAQLERLKARLGLWTKTGEYIQTVIRLLFTNQPMGPNRREMLTEWAEMIEHALRDTESG